MNTIQRFTLTLLCTLASCTALTAAAQERYELDYPGIPYADGPAADAITDLFERRDAGELTLEHHPVRGYLDAVLEALDINPASQVLVFSKTSLKQRFIQPDNPRALYFNDEVYVGWVPGSSSLEIGAMDDVLGPVFFDLPQEQSAAPEPEYQLHRCLRCHDSYSFSGGGVPRFMLSTVLAGENGQIVSHEINLITDTSVPITSRWGGIYVSGSHGEQKHLGNIIVRDAASLRAREDGSNGNLEDLDSRVDLTRYLRNTSDIVALLVLEHQIEVQNRITRAGWEVRNAISEGTLTDELVQEVAEPLLASVLMLEEASLDDAVESTSGYADYFQSLGLTDSNGHSLRELDLNTRTFRFPVSYVVYSDAFRALPEPVLDYVYSGIAAAVLGQERPEGFNLNEDDRHLLINLLDETLPELAPRLGAD